ncbi:hypothetical protein [Chroococcidiopsis sp. TS-821]|uniref:hypothetical protein n=1 Tax=Chroococcidiopsis sp. TS-821 TaxID=1378066 RepID=UPI000CEDC225|nr:hypothetical protein [Chroococcidiopsis sp. TS-821]PPS42656.1 hypothetical protein B1A85_13095 [Chroococcidiopsis sp. TS-821]
MYRNRGAIYNVNFVKGDRQFNFFSTIATLGTPYDITLQELRVECLFPADNVTAENMRKLQAGYLLIRQPISATHRF